MSKTEEKVDVSDRRTFVVIFCPYICSRDDVNGERVIPSAKSAFGLAN
jgi:hypothetical protein